MKRKCSRKTLQKISWIFGRELPFWGWYDCETDEIPFVVDNFVTTIWQAYFEKSMAAFLTLIVKEITHVIIHELIHYMTQPANETEVMDLFPKNPHLTVQQNVQVVEQKVDMASLVLAGLLRTRRIAQIDLGDCNEALEELEEELLGHLE